MNIRLFGIELSFSYKRVLCGVDIEFAEGKIHALLGENGAGKSSLMKILTGYQKPASGKIFLDDKEVSFGNTAASLKHGIACVYQRPFLSDSISVRDNLKIGIRKFRFEENEFLANIDLNAKASELTGDQRFFVAFSASLLRNPGVLILDEPTALLDEDQAERLFRKLRTLSENGMNIIVITHKPEDLKYCDDVTVLEKGKVVSGNEKKRDGSSESEKKETISSFKNVNKENLSAEVCAKLRKEEQNCGIIPTDRNYLAANPNLTITQLVCSTYTESRNPLKRKQHTKEIIEKAGINIRPEEKVYNLSGGMLQRLILERELWNNPEVIYLEDPFQGLDAASCARLSERLEECKNNGSRVVYL